MSYLRTYVLIKQWSDNLTAIFYRSDLKYVKILAILEFAILLAEQPGQHLPGFHAGAHDASGFVPMSATLTASVLLVTLDHL